MLENLDLRPGQNTVSTPTLSSIINLLSWNCRDLGSLRVVQEVTKMVTKYKPQVIFLIEMKRKNHKMEWLRSKWKFDRCFTMEEIGIGGGLAILWINKVQAEVKSFSNYHIDVILGGMENGQAWRFTGF